MYCFFIGAYTIATIRNNTLILTNKNKMKKDINFYRECLKIELSKPFNKQDFMYMSHLDKKIYDLKEKELLTKNKTK